MKKQIVVGALAGLAFILLGGCSLNPMNAFTGGTKSTEINVEKDEAKALKVELNLGAGEMNVAGGSDEWVTGTIDYNKKELAPIVSYDLDGETGKISIGPKRNNDVNFSIGEHKNEWELQLNNDIPTALEVNAGASDTHLDLSGVNLTELSVDAGVGDVKIDLSGNWQESFQVMFHAGIGKTEVILPKDVGVKVVSSKGIGASNFVGLISQGDGVYVNEALETADVVITLEADIGIGESRFQIEK